MRAPRDCQPVLELGIDDGVSANDERAGLVDFLLASGQNLTEHIQRQIAGWKGDNIERRQRLAAHRIDVGKRVGGSDLTEIEWIVNYRRKEIDGLNESEIVGYAKDPGVVEGLSADEQSWIGFYRERGQRAG
jgi:hypothetical protein